MRLMRVLGLAAPTSALSRRGERRMVEDWLTGFIKDLDTICRARLYCIFS